jgi:hypothetical protein
MAMQAPRNVWADRWKGGGRVHPTDQCEPSVAVPADCAEPDDHSDPGVTAKTSPLPQCEATFIASAAGVILRGSGSSTGLSAQGVQVLKDWYSNKQPPRSVGTHELDRSMVDGPIRQRSADLSRIFANQSELDLYRFCTESRLSMFRSEQLLGIVTKVCCARPGCRFAHNNGS